MLHVFATSTTEIKTQLLYLPVTIYLKLLYFSLDFFLLNDRHDHNATFFSHCALTSPLPPLLCLRIILLGASLLEGEVFPKSRGLQTCLLKKHTFPASSLRDAQVHAAGVMTLSFFESPAGA